MGLPRNIDRRTSYFDVLERLVMGVIAVTTRSDPAGGQAIRDTPPPAPTPPDDDG